MKARELIRSNIKIMNYKYNYFENAKKYNFMKHNKWKYKFLKKYANKNVLDIGCGDGRFLKLFPRWVGVDIDEQAKKIFPTRVKIASSIKIPHKSDFFDAIVISHVMEHLTFHEREKTLLEIKRLLKKNGIIFIFIPAPMSMTFYNDFTHKSSLSAKGLINLMESYGFETKIAGYSFLRKLPFKIQEKLVLLFPFIVTEIYGIFKLKKSDLSEESKDRLKNNKVHINLEEKRGVKG